MIDASRLSRAVALGAATAVLAAAAPAAAAPVFDPAVSYENGSGAFSIAAGDVGRDGRVDLVTVNPFGEQRDISLLRGTGGGVFGAPVAYEPGRAAGGVAIGDFTGDGVGDVVVSRTVDGTVALLRGDGSGGLLTPPAVSSVGEWPVRLSAADLNRDGRLDVAVAAMNGGSVTVLLGDGSGGFASGVSYQLGENSWPTDVAAADLDRDGDLDLVSANANSASVSVLSNDGSGRYPTVASYPAGERPSAVTTGDFDGDGAVDVAVADTVDSVSVLRNSGGGALAAPAAYAIGAPHDVKAADLDGDGDLDLAAAATSRDTVVLLEGDGRGRFTARAPLAVGDAPRGLVVADLNGDQQPDLGVANEDSADVSVLLNRGRPSVAVSPTSLDLGSTTVGGSGATRAVTVTNPSGSAVLRVSGLELAGAHAGDFELVSQDCTARAVPVRGSCTIALRARPTAVGARSATLQLGEDAPGEPVTVALAATGVARAPPPGPPRPLVRLEPLTITGVRGSPRCLAQTGRRRPRAGRDVVVSYTLSHAAQVTFTLQRRTSPRPAIRRACPARGGAPRPDRVTWVDVTTGQLRRRGRASAAGASARGRAVTVRVAGRAGQNRFSLSRLLTGRRLAPGAYRLAFQAVRSDGARSLLRVVTFPVLK